MVFFRGASGSGSCRNAGDTAVACGDRDAETAVRGKGPHNVVSVSTKRHDTSPSFRITVVQPAVPSYRLSLFARMAQRFGSGFTVYASRQQELGVLCETSERAYWQRDLGPMRRLIAGLEWQVGALALPVSKGDILIVCGAPRAISTLALLMKGRLKGARTIWWGHYWSSTSKPWRAALRFALMRIPDAILFYTDQEVSEYRAAQGKRVSKPVIGLNNGIETQDIERLRIPFDPSGRPRDLLFIGRVTAKAELGLALEALTQPNCADVTLDVIGDGPERFRLQEWARTLGIGDRVVWHGPTVDETRIAAVANRCKAFLYPGSVGLSLIHGLAYGLPAIVHHERWAHMPEIAALEADKNGVMFRKGDATDLANTADRLLSNAEALKRMSRAAIDLTDRTFNTSDMSERFFRALSAISDSQ